MQFVSSCKLFVTPSQLASAAVTFILTPVGSKNPRNIHVQPLSGIQVHRAPCPDKTLISKQISVCGGIECTFSQIASSNRICNLARASSFLCAEVPVSSEGPQNPSFSGRTQCLDKALPPSDRLLLLVGASKLLSSSERGGYPQHTVPAWPCQSGAARCWWRSSGLCQRALCFRG